MTVLAPDILELGIGYGRMYLISELISTEPTCVI